MSDTFLEHLRGALAAIEADGLTKRERLIEGPQGGRIRVGGREMVNLCANNYLGLADHPRCCPRLHIEGGHPPRK